LQVTGTWSGVINLQKNNVDEYISNYITCKLRTVIGILNGRWPNSCVGRSCHQQL
jgi:hypothetical protein